MKVRANIGKQIVSKILFQTGVCLLFVLGVVGCNDDNGSINLIPADIIIIVDNSGDMTDIIQGLQADINIDFAQVLEDVSLDYRIILIGKYGMLNDESVCIEAPLSGIGNCTNPPAQPVNSAKFFHYSVEINSTNSLCKILETFDAPDDFNLMPNGWMELLRVNSSKFFIEFSNDGVDCFSGVSFDDLNSDPGGTAAAAAFNAALTNLSPAHFGTPANPTYRFLSMTANPDKNAGNPAIPYSVSDPISTSECGLAAHAGTGYQGLSVLTNGVRYSLCLPDNYDIIFNAVAQQIINASSD